jgi:hypothetical protein
MSHWAFWILTAVLGLIVWALGGMDTGGTNGRGPGVSDKCDECGEKKKPSTWGGPR